LSLQSLFEFCDRLGAPVGSVVTPFSDETARTVFLVALTMLGERGDE
jgi:hypothetical protein